MIEIYIRYMFGKGNNCFVIALFHINCVHDFAMTGILFYDELRLMCMMMDEFFLHSKTFYFRK